MMNYTNRFSCSVNNNKTEFIFTFYQDQPIINAKGEVESVNTEEATSVVMTTDLAHKMKEHIERLLGPSL